MTIYKSNYYMDKRELVKRLRFWSYSKDLAKTLL